MARPAKADHPWKRPWYGRKRKSFTIHDVINAGVPLEPLKCLHCHWIGEVTFHPSINDGLCEKCGRWQLKNNTNKEDNCE